MRRKLYKKTISDIIYDIIVYSITIFAVTVTLLPFIHLLSISFSDADSVIRNEVWVWPKGFTVSAFKVVVNENGIWQAYLNTIVYASVATILTVAATMMVAYPLAQQHFVFKRLVTVIILIPMFFSGGLIPTYILIRNLHLYNTMWAVILPGLVVTWNIVLVRTYINYNISNSILEAARIDGMNDIYILFKIVIPLSAPIVAIIALYTIVSQWNSYFSVMIYIPDRQKQTLQIYLMRVLLKNADILSNAQRKLAVANSNEAITMISSMQLRYALVVFVIAPIIMTYPFLQKYFIKGVMVGSLKG